METLLYIALALPLLGALILLCLSPYQNRTLVSVIGCLSIFGSFLCFCFMLFTFLVVGIEAMPTTLFNWIPLEGLKTDFALHLDHLSLLMSLIITGVGFLIHVYSIGYMEHDEDYARYFACMNFFVFSMLLLVLAANVLLLFMGWEGVGLASYLLIGYYTSRNSAAAAATKAFVVNRIGDCGLLIGILLTYYVFGTSDMVTLNAQAKEINVTIITVITLLYFVGSIGKSAQLPLYVWLPDAMEGPTPVSALIHAATMVTAGVYLVVRLNPLFMQAPVTMYVIGIVGAISSLFAAICATSQTDIKKVLAYSTMSQLGLMFLACGVGGFYTAMFHLTTHAFTKALLFLGAGIVIHMMSGTTDMYKMGGLLKKFPITGWLFLIGVLALSGLPPLAPFFSKDLILEEEYLSGFHVLFYVALLASFLTAFYMTRAFYLTFLGQPQINDKVMRHVKEGPWVMIIPVAILAFLTITAGFLGYTYSNVSLLESFLQQIGISSIEQEIELHLMPFQTYAGTLALIGALLGVGGAFFLYSRYSDKMGSPLTFFRKTFYVDEIYEVVIVTPLKAVARGINKYLEPYVFEGSMEAVSGVALDTTKQLKKFQSGEIRSYLAWMGLAMSIFIIYMVW